LLPDRYKDLHIDLRHVPFEVKLKEYARAFLGIKYGTLANNLNTSSYRALLDSIFTPQDFTYSFTKVNCVTFVELVLALATLDSNLKSYQDIQNAFELNLKKIRYFNGKPSFWARKHFFSSEWIPGNESLLQDISPNLPVTESIATARIDRLSWLYKTIINKSFADIEHRQLSQDITQYINQPMCITHSMPYIAIQDWELVKSAMPAITIATIVFPGYDLTDTIGSELNVIHLGLLFKENNQFNFIHAAEDKAVVKVVFDDYVTKFLSRSNFKGIGFLGLKCSNMIS